MLKIDRTDWSLCKLASSSVADSSICARYGLQEFRRNSPDAFYKEIGEDLFFYHTEIMPSKDVAVGGSYRSASSRLKGAVVVIELKRGTNKLQMIQVISYAGMISHRLNLYMVFSKLPSWSNRAIWSSSCSGTRSTISCRKSHSS